MFNYRLKKDLGPDANVQKGKIYNEYFIITGVKDEPYFVKDAAEENKFDWELIPEKRSYPGIL